MAKIEFHATRDHMRLFPKPYPASKAVPEWFKAMPMNATAKPEIATVKRCPPFLQAITAGYIIPMPCDVTLTVNAEGLLRPTAEHPVFGIHPPDQYEGAPFFRAAVLKFHNPWIVKTPLGVSCLFIAPINRFELPIFPLSGIIETDSYYAHVHLPTLVSMPPNTTRTLAKGTPLIQVIPFARDSWSSEALEANSELLQAAGEGKQSNRHIYKDKHWRKIEFD